MGQYFKIVNLDKKQYLHPHEFGDGLKLTEFSFSGCGTMSGLAILLADGNGQGGGDLDSANPIIGSWAGDRIVVAGDYAENGKFVDGTIEDELKNIYSLASDNWEDISKKVIEALMGDSYYKQNARRGFGE